MAVRDTQISTYYTPASTGAKTCPVPSNQVNDIMLIKAYTLSNVTMTWPSGFTALTSTTFQTSRGLTAWSWKRVAGSPDSGTYSMTPSGSTQSQYHAISISGRITTGSPFTFTTQGQTHQPSTPFQPAALSGTAAAGDDLIYLMQTWNVDTGMTVSGFTLIQEDTTNGPHGWKQENTSAGLKSVQSSGTSTGDDFWTMLASLIAAPVAAGIPDLVMAPPRSRF